MGSGTNKLGEIVSSFLFVEIFFGQGKKNSTGFH
jgi:hypothetical protein